MVPLKLTNVDYNLCFGEGLEGLALLKKEFLVRGLFLSMDGVSEKGVEKFVVRFPEGMRSQIHKAANREGRSMNKEIIARLEHSLVNFETISRNLVVKWKLEDGTEFSGNPSLVSRDRGVTVFYKEGDEEYSQQDLEQELSEKLGALSLERKKALLKLLSTT